MRESKKIKTISLFISILSLPLFHIYIMYLICSILVNFFQYLPENQLVQNGIEHYIRYIVIIINLSIMLNLIFFQNMLISIDKKKYIKINIIYNGFISIILSILFYIDCQFSKYHRPL